MINHARDATWPSESQSAVRIGFRGMRGVQDVGRWIFAMAKSLRRSVPAGLTYGLLAFGPVAAAFGIDF